MVKGKGYYKRKKLTKFVKGEDNPNYTDKSEENREGCSRSRITKQSRKCPTVFRPTKRYTEDEFKRWVKSSKYNIFSIPGADGKEGSARVLRAKKSPPKPTKEKKKTNHTFEIDVGNFISEKTRLLQLFMDFIEAHEDREECVKMDFDIVEFKPWGAFVSVIGKCRNCTYRSDRTRLYEEVESDGKPGRKAAKGNMGLQFVEQDCQGGNTETQQLIAGLGVRPGSLNGMQKLAYKAAKITEKLGEAEIKRQQERMIKLLEERGVDKPPKGVSALLASSFDVMYSGMFKASHVTPGTGAQQTVGTCIEQVSGDGNVVGVDFASKLCLTASRMKGRGKTPICGPKANHRNCTATQGREVLIEEKHIAERIAKSMYKDSGLVNTHICTDSDGKGLMGFEEANEKIKKQIEQDSKNTDGKWKNKSTRNANSCAEEDESVIPPVHWHKDPIHLGWNIGRHIKSHTFNAKFFGRKANGKLWNYKEREECRKWLAIDVPTRVDLAIDNLRDHCEKNYDLMRNYANHVAKCMVLCYGGNHEKCERSDLAQLTGCRGAAENKCWFFTSINMTAPGITRLDLRSSQEDTQHLRKVIAEKLSYENIDYVAAGHTTSQCEHTNRAYTKSLPNNRNYYRTAKARVMSTVMRKNQTLLESTKTKFEAGGCALPEGSGPLEVFEKYASRREQNLAAKEKPEAKARKIRHTETRKRQHAKERLKATNKSEYRKYQLDEVSKAHEEAVQSNQYVHSTGKLMKKAKGTVQKRTVRAFVNKVNAQKKRRQTMAANRAMVEEARVVNKAATPVGLHEHDYAVIPGVPVPGIPASKQGKYKFDNSYLSFMPYLFNNLFNTVDILDDPLRVQCSLLLYSKNCSNIFASSCSSFWSLLECEQYSHKFCGDKGGYIEDPVVIWSPGTFSGALGGER